MSEGARPIARPWHRVYEVYGFIREQNPFKLRMIKFDRVLSSFRESDPLPIGVIDLQDSNLRTRRISYISASEKQHLRR